MCVCVSSAVYTSAMSGSIVLADNGRWTLLYYMQKKQKKPPTKNKKKEHDRAKKS